MPRIADLFFKAAITFLIFGILMGLKMSISGDHNVIGAHAHTNLLGWVTMAIFGGYYALNPEKSATRLASVHFWTYVGAVAVMAPSLYLLYLGHTAAEAPLAVSSIVAFLSVVLFAVVVFSPSGTKAGTAKPAVPAE